MCKSTVCSGNWWKVSKSPEAGTSEDGSLSPLNSAPRILKQAGRLSAVTHEPESASTETMSKEWWRGLQSPLLQNHHYLLELAQNRERGEEG